MKHVVEMRVYITKQMVELLCACGWRKEFPIVNGNYPSGAAVKREIRKHKRTK